MTDRPTGLSPAELDAAYTRLCETLGAVGEAQAPLLLARFALLAIVHIGDAAVVQGLLSEAALGLPEPASAGAHPARAS